MIIPRAATARDREQVFNVRKRPLRVFGARRAGRSWRSVISVLGSCEVGVLVWVLGDRGALCHMQKEDIKNEMFSVEEKSRVCKVYS